jgi:hypothetical protein
MNTWFDRIVGAAGIVLVGTGGGTGSGSQSTPVRRDVVGRLHLDARARCAWVNPVGVSDQSDAAGAPVELVFPDRRAAGYGLQLRRRRR